MINIARIFLIVSVFVSAHLSAQVPELILPDGHTDRVCSGSFSPDGQFVITSGLDKTAIIWEKLTGKKLKQLPIDRIDSQSFALYSNTGQFIAAGTDSSFTLWSNQTF